MALSPQEQAELAQLNAEASSRAPQAQAPSSLSPAEAAELAQLNAEASTAPHPYGPKEGAPQGLGDLASRVADPQRWKDIATGKDSYNDVEDANGYTPKPVMGTPPLVTPAGNLPGVASFMGKVGSSALGRIASSAAQGALGEGAKGPLDKSLSDRLDAAKGGAMVGGAVGVGAEALGGIASLLQGGARRLARFSPGEANAYLNDKNSVLDKVDSLDAGTPEAAIDRMTSAKDALQASRRGLRSEGLQEAGKLRELLAGKSASVNPAEWTGVHPGLDEALQAQANPYGQLPRQASVPLETLNDAKRAAQAAAEYRPSPGVFDPVGASKAADMAEKARQLRQLVEKEGGDGVQALNNSMQEKAILSQELRKGLRNPVGLTESMSPDKLGKLALADRASGGGGLFKHANEMAAAKTILKGDVGSGIPSVGIKDLGRAAMEATHGTAQSVKEGIPQMTLNEILRRAFGGSGVQ